MTDVVCEGCGTSYNPSQVTMYQMETAWVRVHPSSTSRHLKRAEQRFLCKPCLDGMERVPADQPRLFES